MKQKKEQTNRERNGHETQGKNGTQEQRPQLHVQCQVNEAAATVGRLRLRPDLAQATLSVANDDNDGHDGLTLYPNRTDGHFAVFVWRGFGKK